jgi:MAC/Perforin domain
MKSYPGLLLSFFLLLSISSCDFVANLTDSSKDAGSDPSEASGFVNLGAGYDVFDNYADVEKVKAVILDTEAMNGAGLIEQKTLEKSVFETSSGTSISTYASSLQVMASLEGEYMYFSGAVKTNFSQSRYKSEEYSFATVHSSINKYILRVNLGLTGADLIPYLTEQAKSVINDPAVTPAALFNVYGTHVLTGIIVGGRLDFNISARTTDLSASKSIGVYATASFKNSFSSASVSVETLSDSEWASYNNSKEEKLEIYGGASEFGQFIINDGQYEQWIGSIQDNLVFADFTSSNALMPIWELADASERKSQLLAGFNTWASDRLIITTPAPRKSIIDVRVQNSGSDNLANTFVSAGLTFTKLPIDLNAGSGGDFIYVYYTIGLDDGSSGLVPINDLYTIDASDGEGSRGSGDFINVDLNRRAGGDDIFLAFNRGFGPTIIRGIRVHNSSKNQNVYSAGTSANNSWIPINQQGTTQLQDMNENAGGNDIYIYYTYDDIQ